MFKTLTLLALISLLAAIGHGERGWSDTPNQHFIKNVPFTRQLPNFCGPASLSSLLAYWGITTTQEEIASRTYDRASSGTNGADLLLYCREIGLSAYSFNGTIQELKEFVLADLPVMVLQDRSGTWKEGHFRLVVGYNDPKGTVTLRDSTQADLVVLSYAEFDRLWNRRGRWAMLALPSKTDTFQKTMGDGNPVLHMDLAQAYLRRGQFRLAEEECMKALDLQPENIYARKILAKVRSHRV